MQNKCTKKLKYQPQVHELLADNNNNVDPVLLHSHLQDCLAAVHAQVALLLKICLYWIWNFQNLLKMCLHWISNFQSSLQDWLGVSVLPGPWQIKSTRIWKNTYLRHWNNIVFYLVLTFKNHVTSVPLIRIIFGSSPKSLPVGFF